MSEAAVERAAAVLAEHQARDSGIRFLVVCTGNGDDCTGHFSLTSHRAHVAAALGAGLLATPAADERLTAVVLGDEMRQRLNRLDLWCMTLLDADRNEATTPAVQIARSLNADLAALRAALSQPNAEPSCPACIGAMPSHHMSPALQAAHADHVAQPAAEPSNETDAGEGAAAREAWHVLDGPCWCLPAAAQPDPASAAGAEGGGE